MVHLKIGWPGWVGKSGSFAPALKKKPRGLGLGASRRKLKIMDGNYCWGGWSPFVGWDGDASCAELDCGCEVADWLALEDFFGK